MSYVKVGWKDYPDTSTPVNAENLNHMDDQISLMDKDVEDLKNDVDNMNETEKSLSEEIESLNSSLANGQIKFGIDEDGNYGYIKAGADTVTPFKSGGDYTRLNQFTCSLPTTSVSNSGSGVSNSSTSAKKTVYKIPAGSTIKFTYSTTVSANGWVSAGLYMNGSSIISTGQVTSTISSKSLTYVVPETIEDAVFYSKCKNGSATGASGTFAITIKAITITLPE